MVKCKIMLNFAVQNEKNESEMKIIGRLLPMLLALAACSAGVCLQGCSKDDGPLLSDLLPGSWFLEDYEIVIDADSSSYLTIERFEFGKDGRFHVFDLYQPGVLDSGRYEAGNDYIRFEYERADEDYMLLWQVHSFSKERVSASYKDAEHKITARVTLGKERPAWMDE